MKKIFLLMAILPFQIMAVTQKSYYYPQASRTAFYQNTRRPIKRTAARPIQTKSHYAGESLTDFCRRCCAEGRNVSRECALKCNNCQAFSDEGASEARDFPN